MALPIKANAAGIYQKEIDQSNNLTVAGTSVGAMVCRAPQGIANREVIVSDYPTYVNNFGNSVFSATSSTPDVPVFGYGSYVAEEFLKESNELHVVRIVDGNDRYPHARFTSTYGTGTEKWDDGSITYLGTSAIMTPENPDTDGIIQAIDNDIGATDYLLIGALGPGTTGHNIGVTIETFNVSSDSAGLPCDWFLNYDDYPTNSAVSQYITSATDGDVASVASLSAAINAVGYNLFTEVLPVASKVLKISVYTKKDNELWSEINSKIDDGDVSISDMTPVEIFYGTLSYQKDASNRQLHLKEIVNGVSQYIYVAHGNSGQLDYEIIPMHSDIVPLSGGAISNKTGLGGSDNSDLSAVLSAWDFYSDKEYATVNILLNPDWNTSVKQKINTIAANRMDCIAVGQSGGVSAVTVEAIQSAEKYGYKNPSYIALYAGWDLKYDQANDRNLYIPKSILGAPLFARVDRTGQTWDAPAGDPNGILSTLGQNKIFKFTDIGRLQVAGINTSRFLRSTGHTMWGQRTAQIKNTALTRINVRRLLIYIEQTIEQTMFPFLFNIVNDDKQRLRISTLLNNFLLGVKAGGGVTSAEAICTDQNNTPEIIDNQQMVIDVFVIPTKPVEVIQINTRIVKTGVSFNEIVI